MYRALTALMSPGGRRGTLSAFTFHRVLAAPELMLPDEPDALLFSRLLEWIGAQFRVLDPLDACRRLAEGRLPSRAAIITFDDGYRDNLEVALPLLQRHGMPAAVFVASSFGDGTAMFNDRIIHALGSSARSELVLPWLEGGPVALHSVQARREGIGRLIRAVKHCSGSLRVGRVDSIVEAAGADAPRGLMLNPGQVRTLAAAGMTIGGHTRSHPILSSLGTDDAWREIEGGRQDLADVLGTAPLLFAYPNGRRDRDYKQEHQEMVARAGYEFAFSTHPGVSTRATDRFQLRRFTPWDTDRTRFSLRALKNLMSNGFVQSA